MTYAFSCSEVPFLLRYQICHLSYLFQHLEHDMLFEDDNCEGFPVLNFISLARSANPLFSRYHKGTPMLQVTLP